MATVERFKGEKGKREKGKSKEHEPKGAKAQGTSHPKPRTKEQAHKQGQAFPKSPTKGKKGLNRANMCEYNIYILYNDRAKGQPVAKSRKGWHDKKQARAKECPPPIFLCFGVWVGYPNQESAKIFVGVIVIQLTQRGFL